MTDPSERITIQELLYHPWLNRMSFYPLVPLPTFQIMSLVRPPFYFDPWHCFTEISSISFIKEENSFHYKIQDLSIPHPALQNHSSKKNSTSTTFGVTTGDTASFEDIVLHDIEAQAASPSVGNQKTSLVSHSEFTKKASGSIAYVGHLLSSFSSTFEPTFPVASPATSSQPHRQSSAELFRFGRKEKLKYSILEASSKFEVLLKILNISYDTWVITKTKILARDAIEKSSRSCLPIENENDITAFLFKCQYETSLKEIYVFEVYLERSSKLSSIFDNVPKYISRPFSRSSSSSSTFNSQSSISPNHHSTTISMDVPSQPHSASTIQYKLFVSKDMHRAFLEKFEHLVWDQFIVEKMKF